MHLCLLTGDLHATVEQLRQADITIDREPKVGLMATGRPGFATQMATRSS